MRVEAITVSKDYDDFLEHTLPRNLDQVDFMFVVTHPSDTKTQELCSRYSKVKCLLVPEAFDQDGIFNKGLAIDMAIDAVTEGSWILHIDADIVLPIDFRRQLERAELEAHNIHGAERCRIRGYHVWQEWKDKIDAYGRGQFEGDTSGYLLRKPKQCHVDARFIDYETGYVPLGYFQLWHSGSKHRYPKNFTGANGSDISFAQFWPRARRVLLPEFVVYHLDSEKNPVLGSNWRGRVSPRFEDASESQQHCP